MRGKILSVVIVISMTKRLLPAHCSQCQQCPLPNFCFSTLVLSEYMLQCKLN